MKTNTKKSNQSSVPVQHSHTPERNEREEAIRLANDACRFHPELEKPAAKPAAPAPDAKPDNRLPIDYAQRAENRKLDTATVCTLLRDLLPAVHQTAKVVGAWVWVQFNERPDAAVRQQLSQLGFHWNNTRQAWQHPCGKFSLGSKSDPRDTYASKPAMEALN